MNKLITIIKSIFTGTFKMLLTLFRSVRRVNRKDTPEQELRLFDRLMTWAIVMVIILLFIVLAGWDYVFTAG